MGSVVEIELPQEFLFIKTTILILFTVYEPTANMRGNLGLLIPRSRRQPGSSLPVSALVSLGLFTICRNVFLLTTGTFMWNV